MSAILYIPKNERERRAKEALAGVIRVAWRKKGCTTCRPIVVTAKPLKMQPEQAKPDV